MYCNLLLGRRTTCNWKLWQGDCEENIWGPNSKLTMTYCRTYIYILNCSVFFQVNTPHSVLFTDLQW
ncbi:hypothetical protein JHK82_013883 [Glycine max]|uniref:Uncharacterized protein n=2 Tax=Glycine subgen. Soja TaxID=1462606 RepID=K7KRG4_SOYBN|nr:hypothetical protein JHK87_013792 [Glycine soja]KAG5041784.1 hypothetical protein JHK85_014260 [Glycine max]KAG5058897.1 hypothetical protein JHK86_013893 [Glycine max]KAG5155914.1 hypothetical protein JHK82_013883 [Glycine max]KAH1079783.1 hypothetical protein GYH30_056968 [Glycine max]